MRKKCMAPVEDWLTAETKKVKNIKHGVEATKKHHEREAVAKYIFNKFGVHLLNFNHQTRIDAIPIPTDYIRQTNS